MDATGSLIAPTDNKDKDDMSVNDADTEAAKNTLANTTGIKSISLLNAKGGGGIVVIVNVTDEV